MSRSLKTMSLLPLGNTDAYLQQINSIAILSAEEELQLATRWYEQGDVEAAKRLVMAHVRFVVRIARGYMGYGLQLADLIQEGNIGLMKAVKRFNPTMGVRLVSFAVHWIKSEIHEFIIRNWRIVKVATTKAQRKLFFNLRSMKKRLGWFSEAEIQGVAADLGVTAADVREMESRLNANDAAFDLAPGESDEMAVGRLPAPVLYLEDKSSDPLQLLEKERWQSNAAGKLKSGLQALKARERYIVQQRWLNDKKATLQELSQELNVSAERIRQIEKAALSKLGSVFTAEEKML